MAETVLETRQKVNAAIDEILEVLGDGDMYARGELPSTYGPTAQLAAIHRLVGKGILTYTDDRRLYRADRPHTENGADEQRNERTEAQKPCGGNR